MDVALLGARLLLTAVFATRRDRLDPAALLHRRDRGAPASAISSHLRMGEESVTRRIVPARKRRRSAAAGRSRRPSQRGCSRDSRPAG